MRAAGVLAEGRMFDKPALNYIAQKSIQVLHNFLNALYISFTLLVLFHYTQDFYLSQRVAYLKPTGTQTNITMTEIANYVYHICYWMEHNTELIHNVNF